ncbi:hypothetical protein CAEBREN_18592 [Caenorhabditis brenneri]|uniref:Serpentine receptor class gamma n=1 Tax=Caenorhabditis brenneri TaxID=135651 RepID=G0ND72_CAEBE|nr:hypothetical protein CAEBREN_18592 [Caenorhabditis brenneri]
MVFSRLRYEHYLFSATQFGIRLRNFETTTQFLVFLEEIVPNTLTISRFMLLVFFHIQNASLIALSVHRVTSVYSMSSDKFWKHGYIMSFLLCLLLPFGIYAWNFLTDSVPTKISIVNREIKYNTNQVKLSILADYTMMTATFYFILTLGLGIAALNKLVQRRRKTKSSGKPHGRKMKRMIIVQCVLNSGNLLLLIGVGLAYHICDYATVLEVQMFLVLFTSDLVILSMPYLLLKFDFNVRCLFGLKKTTVLKTSSMYSIRKSTNYVIN